MARETRRRATTASPAGRRGRTAPGVTRPERVYAGRPAGGTAASLAQGLRAMQQPVGMWAEQRIRRIQQEESRAGAAAALEGSDLEDFDASEAFADSYMKLHGKKLGMEYASELQQAMADPEQFDPHTDDPVRFAEQFRAKWWGAVDDQTVREFATPDIVEGEFRAVESAQKERFAGVVRQRQDNFVAAAVDEAGRDDFNIRRLESLGDSLTNEQRNAAYLTAAERLAEGGDVAAVERLLTTAPKQGVKPLAKGRFAPEAEAIMQAAVRREREMSTELLARDKMHLYEELDGQLAKGELITYDELEPHVTSRLLSPAEARSYVNKSLKAANEVDEDLWMREVVLAGKINDFAGGHTDKTVADFKKVADRIVAEQPEGNRVATAIQLYRRNGVAPNILANNIANASPTNPENFKRAVDMYERVAQTDPALADRLVNREQGMVMRLATVYRQAGWSDEEIGQALQSVDPSETQRLRARWEGRVRETVDSQIAQDGWIFDTNVGELENSGAIATQVTRQAESLLVAGLVDDVDMAIETAAANVMNNHVVVNGMALPVTPGVPAPSQEAIDGFLQELPSLVDLPDNTTVDDYVPITDFRSLGDRRTLALVHKETRQPLDFRIDLQALALRHGAQQDSVTVTDLNEKRQALRDRALERERMAQTWSERVGERYR